MPPSALRAAASERRAWRGARAPTGSRCRPASALWSAPPRMSPSSPSARCRRGFFAPVLDGSLANSADIFTSIRTWQDHYGQEPDWPHCCCHPVDVCCNVGSPVESASCAQAVQIHFDLEQRTLKGGNRPWNGTLNKMRGCLANCRAVYLGSRGPSWRGTSCSCS